MVSRFSINGYHRRPSESESWQTDLEEVQEISRLLRGSVRKRITELNGDATPIPKAETDNVVIKTKQKSEVVKVAAIWPIPKTTSKPTVAVLPEEPEPIQTSIIKLTKVKIEPKERVIIESTVAASEETKTSNTTVDEGQSNKPTTTINKEPLRSILAQPRRSFKEKKHVTDDQSRKVTFQSEPEIVQKHSTVTIRSSPITIRPPPARFEEDHRATSPPRIWHDHVQPVHEGSKPQANGWIRSSLREIHDSIKLDERDRGLRYKNNVNGNGTGKLHRKI